MDFLEYSDISAEIKGSMVPGRIKMTDQTIIFKNSKTGKVEQISSGDMELVNFQRFVGSWGLRIFLKNGILHRFGGFKEGEQEKVAKFFKTNYSKDMLEKELCLKGWNWGTAKFNGSLLSFDIGSRTAFEIPLQNVSQCTTGKNEVTLEFHQNDETPVSLMEMRFHIPTSEMAGDLDPVDAFHRQVMDKASVISVSGDAIAIFRELQCLTPRGRYDIKIFQTFFQLHGKTYDYKIPMSTVLRLFLLPHKDGRQMFFIVSLDPPIKQGQTRYHFLVLLFSKEEEITIELPFSEKELEEKYEGKITKELSGPTYEVLGKIMKVVINRKLTGPGTFVGHTGTPAISCSYKAAAGFLYPLEKGFINIHKPPIHIRFEEIAFVNFARSGGSTRSFDFEIELKSGTVHTFSSIEKEEYGKLFDYISSKKLNVKNTGKDKQSYKDDFGDSDAENEPDAYLARVKAEGKERDEDDDKGDDSNSDESTDEDFNPDQQEGSDVALEFDSNHTSESESGSGEGGSDAEKKKKKKPKSAKTVREKATTKPKSSSKKKKKDANAPKRPGTAFMIWMNETRKDIMAKNPGLKITEVAKKAGEMWKEMKDKSEWEGKAAKSKEEYNKAMKEYKESGGGGGGGAANSSDEDTKASSKSAKKKKKGSDDEGASKSKKRKETTPKAAAPGAYKSKEYISDDDSSSDDDDDKPKSKKEESSKTSSSNSKDKKKKKESSEEEEEEMSEAETSEEEAASSGGSDDDDD